ncbi:unnamed protein product [Phaedon cochleariae]|uniref:Double jelly roll-like domain-containing protein n=1 Tax=Phaedon cochleariae TaxID=80249 RepID=A0A9N9SG68_PHACE|nr:unnamed protein product [Phaedon cochleariae]
MHYHGPLRGPEAPHPYHVTIPGSNRGPGNTSNLRDAKADTQVGSAPGTSRVPVPDEISSPGPSNFGSRGATKMAPGSKAERALEGDISSENPTLSEEERLLSDNVAQVGARLGEMKVKRANRSGAAKKRAARRRREATASNPNTQPEPEGNRQPQTSSKAQTEKSQVPRNPKKPAYAGKRAAKGNAGSQVPKGAAGQRGSEGSERKVDQTKRVRSTGSTPPDQRQQAKRLCLVVPEATLGRGTFAQAAGDDELRRTIVRIGRESTGFSADDLLDFRMNSCSKIEFKKRDWYVVDQVLAEFHLVKTPESLILLQPVKVVERANTALQGSPQTQSIAKITIESINLKVPHLTPNDDIKLQLLTRIKADESMMIPFRRWELHELPALTQGSTIEIWSVKTCSALDSPRYVIVFFQTKKADNLHEDVTLFDNANIKSIRLALNSDYYPQERMLLDFSRDQYADAHFNYTEFNKSYHNCQEKRSLVNFAEFKSRPMFVIDCSRRYLGLKSSTVDIKSCWFALPVQLLARKVCVYQ